MQKNVFVYCNGNSKIGSGHFWRCLNIADELRKRQLAITFLYTSLSDKLQQVLAEKEYPGTALNTTLKEGFTEYLNGQSGKQRRNLLIVDSDLTEFYELDFQNAVIQTGTKLMIITVNPNFKYVSHLILNQNILSLSQNYDTSKETRALFGPEYFIYKLEYRDEGVRKKTKTNGDVLIAFGGADPCNYTFQLMKFILTKTELEHINFHVVVGPLNPQLDDIMEMCSGVGNVSVYYNTIRMKEIMQSCAIAVCSPGMVYWESILLGLRTILLSSSPREKPIAKFLNDQHYGLTISNYDEPLSIKKFELLEKELVLGTTEFYSRLDHLRGMINPKGVEKVAEEIEKILI
ncbi:hypothetical protein [Flagellimonas sp.]|uniref:hypothetical protein n=1 Tax=Flagellimonas sp. TaxID=2058762 RepID=UPI003B529D89